MTTALLARLVDRGKLGWTDPVTRHLPDGPDSPIWSIYDASMAYQKDGVPLMVIAGKEYGSGSSRDWAAKGTNLLGVKAVLAESYERIHRSNLVGMGVLPLQFKPGESAASLGLTGEEVYDIAGLVEGLQKKFDGASKELTVTAKRANGTDVAFKAISRIDAGKFTVCEICGEHISAERHAAVAYATQCERCASS